MNWTEFVEEGNKMLSDIGINPDNTIVRVEVSDSHYDKNVEASDIGCALYLDGGKMKLHMIIHGGAN